MEMISFLSKSIALYLLKKEIIDSEEQEICEYGFELIIATIIGLILVLLSGMILGELISAVIFYSMFVIVRFFTGGYHANTHLKCKLTLVTCCLFVITMTKILGDECSILGIIIPLFFYIFSVIAFSPVEHINSPMTENLRIRNRKISIITAIILVSLNLVCFKYYTKYVVASSLTLFVIADLIIIAKINEGRITDYEKSHK